MGLIVGYARKSANWSLERQREPLTAQGVQRMYEDEPKNQKAELVMRKEAIRVLRRGDVLVVAGLHRLGRNREGMRQALEDIAARGASVRDALTGRELPLEKVVLDALDLFLDALAVWAGEKSMPGRKAAEERGIQGGRPPKRLKADAEEAAKLWRNPKVPVEKVETLTGLSKRTLLRRFGPRTGDQ